MFNKYKQPLHMLIMTNELISTTSTKVEETFHPLSVLLTTSMEEMEVFS